MCWPPLGPRGGAFLDVTAPPARGVWAGAGGRCRVDGPLDAALVAPEGLPGPSVPLCLCVGSASALRHVCSVVEPSAGLEAGAATVVWLFFLRIPSERALQPETGGQAKLSH